MSGSNDMLQENYCTNTLKVHTFVFPMYYNCFPTGTALAINVEKWNMTHCAGGRVREMDSGLVQSL